jgi:hypothetical protein
MNAPVSHWAVMQRPVETGEAIIGVGGVSVESYAPAFKRLNQPSGETP